MKFRNIAFAAIAALAFLAGGAVVAQVTVPTVTNVSPTDLFADVVGGVPTASTKYATAAQIAGVPGYRYTVPITAFTLTFGNSQVWYLINPSGTLATGTFTTAPNPGDGQRECVRSTQTQTAVTITANTGQTMNSAITAMTANTSYCWTYVASLATWFNS